MPYRNLPSYNAKADSFLTISKPGSGGLDLYDLPYQQELNQSPYLLNMMYRNGSFSKRFGQEYYRSFDENVYASYSYNGMLVIHVGDKIVVNDEVVYKGLSEKRGLFFVCGTKLYYLCDEYYVFDGHSFEVVEPYIPDTIINRRPNPEDGEGDVIDDYNLIGSAFRNNFHGDGTSTSYKVAETYLDKKLPLVTVDNVDYVYDETLTEDNSFKVDYETGVITFKEAPPQGDNNVEIVAFKTFFENIDKIYGAKYATNFGGNNDSRVFLAGVGDSYLYFSSVFDATYFPENNYLRIGNTEDDITGLGKQYNILVVFKPREMYSVSYYTITTADTVAENKVGLGGFKSQAINSFIGCDCPNTIQLINSQLTWLSSLNGVCTLISSYVLDERNVRTISRNIDRTNYLGVEGLLDWPNIKETVSADFDGKYFLANKTNGKCFMWDYVLSPYSNTGRIEDDAKRLSWFLFDNFYVESFQNRDNDLLYLNENKIVKLNNTFNDFGQTIDSIYMTPLFEYNVSAGGSTRRAVEYLKTIKNVYVQCRGEHATEIEIRYISEENPEGEVEQEPIKIPSRLWESFTYESFNYAPLNFMNVFRRKCSIKKVQIMGIKFSNNVLNADMSISHLTLQYDNVKNVK